MSELDDAVARLAALPPPKSDPRDEKIERMIEALREIAKGTELCPVTLEYEPTHGALLAQVTLHDLGEQSNGER